MSAAALMLQIIFAFFGFLLSFKGVFALLLGVLGFLALPIIPNATGEFKRLANFHLWLAAQMLQRASIVVSEHGDLLLKRMTFDDLGVEKISFGSESKEFEDPDSSLHHWMGIPFALADERHGVLFDPRHAALGRRKRDSDERGETTVSATQDEWDHFRVHEWKRAVYEMPKKHEHVDLSAIRHLVDGGERAEYPKRVEQLYQHSRAPFESATSATRFVMIIFALLAPFAMMWLIASQGDSTPTAGSTIGYGGSFLLFAGGATDVLARAKEALGGSGGGDGGPDIDWGRAAKVLAVALPVPLIFLLLFVFVSPLTAIFVFATVGLGFLFMPFLSILLRPSAKLGGGFARLLMKLGLLGYNRPVLEWTSAKYQLREYDELDHDGSVKWYGLQGSLLGFTFEPGQESWGAEVVEPNNIKAHQEPLADGGLNASTNIPPQHVRAPDIRRASSYAGFVPKRVDDDHYYLNTGIALGRFRDSAVGEKALQRLLWAKEEYGGDNSLSDRTIVYAMVGCGVLSAGLGVFVFFL